MNSKKHKLPRRILAMLLAICMFVTMFPSAMFAVEGEAGDTPTTGQTETIGGPAQSNDDVTINKTAVRTGADTWDVTMTVTAKEKDLNPVPLDVVLVMDTSYSMNERIDRWEQQTRMDAAKAAAMDLVNMFEEKDIPVKFGVVSFGTVANTNQELVDVSNEGIINAIDDLRANDNAGSGRAAYTNMKLVLKKLTECLMTRHIQHQAPKR